MKYTVTRDISVDECPWLRSPGCWLPFPVLKGTTVYTFHGPTFGVIGPHGMAVSAIEGEYPFTELPRSALERT